MWNAKVAHDAWPQILVDLHRLGASAGELCRITEMVDYGLHDVAFSLVDAVLARLREEHNQRS